MTRRDFVKTALRWTALGALGLGTAKLFSRDGGLQGQSCSSDGICSRCSTVYACGLPQALSYKQAQKVLK
jgi:hypothetical protein